MVNISNGQKSVSLESHTFNTAVNQLVLIAGNEEMPSELEMLVTTLNNFVSACKRCSSEECECAKQAAEHQSVPENAQNGSVSDFVGDIALTHARALTAQWRGIRRT